MIWLHVETPYDCFMENWLLVKQDAKLSEFITLVQVSGVDDLVKGSKSRNR